MPDDRARVNRVQAPDLSAASSDLRRALVSLRWHRHKTPEDHPAFDRLIDAESYVEDAIRQLHKAEEAAR